MRLLFLFWFRYIVRALVSLRYRVTVMGAEKLKGMTGPTLVCPNHPGFIDPILVMSFVGGEIPLRPLVTSSMYRRVGLYPLMRLIHALEVPELMKHSHSAREQAQTLINTVVDGLDHGGMFLIYPSGRLERRGIEILGGTRAVPDVLTARPNTRLVLVRTVGVWGSMSTFAPTGTDPNLELCFVRAIWTLLMNLIFFAPRRHVTLTIEIADVSQLPSLGREHLNPFLEEWYNRSLSTTPTYVPYHFAFGPRSYQFPSFEKQGDVKWQKVPEKTRTDVVAILEQKLKRPLTETEREGATLLESLGLDSLDRMEVALSIEQQFGFRSDEIATTLGELWALAGGLVQEGPKKPISVPALWHAERSEAEAPLNPLKETITGSFVQQALAHPREAIVADDLSGVVTYEKILVGVQLMAKRFKAFPGDAVGILLPASVAADTAVLAAMMAGKLPVLLNWTTGPGNLEHAVKTLKIQRVVASQKFLDRIGGEIQEAFPKDSFFFLEDFKKSLSKWEMLGTLVSTRFFGQSILTRVPKQSAHDPAVVLFTSGSEKAPKAVPLTHNNILHDVRAGGGAASFTRGDVLLGFLPPFHSFGLSGNIVMPLVSGMRVVHHADPTDSAGLVRKIAAYKATALLSTPTFLNYIMSAAKPEDLASVRLVVTGAEKCPDAVFEKAVQMMPSAVISEGYGITECAPVVAVNRPRNIRRGTIGQPIEGVHLQVVHPETHEPLSVGERGLLLVSGPTVFPGYLNYDGASPFLDIDGVRWYNTGDLVSLDADQFITFAGRQKRFLKAGGEMISLPALEEPLALKFPPDDQGPRVAVEGVELPNGRCIVAFATIALDVAQANALLAEAGFRGIMRLDEVRRVEKIPVLGTGKTDYKVLRAQI